MYTNPPRTAGPRMDAMATTTQIAQPRWDQIPQELQTHDRWVLWRYDDAPGRGPTKVPYFLRSSVACDHTGRPLRVFLTRASATNPKTWMPYDAVREALQAWPGQYGIGFVLGSGWTGIDLDHVWSRDTRAITDPCARRIVDEFGRRTYTEVSPSGTGLKMIMRGKKPGPAAAHPRVTTPVWRFIAMAVFSR